MSVLLWWLPALVVVAAAWWRLRPGRRVRDEDLRRLQQVLRGDR
jgi:cytochrome c-type biogenesis protein CcmH/NrfF